MTMYPRTNYEMTEADEKALLEACRPVAYIVVGGHEPRSPQENANAAWADLGRRMGFDHMSARPIAGKGTRFFSAVPNENEVDRKAREARETEEKRQREIATLNAEIEERQKRLAELAPQ
jgi:glucuronate isomerase